MIDITKCTNSMCEIKQICWRWMASSNSSHQSMSNWEGGDGCTGFWDMWAGKDNLDDDHECKPKETSTFGVKGYQCYCGQWFTKEGYKKWKKKQSIIRLTRKKKMRWKNKRGHK